MNLVNFTCLGYCQIMNIVPSLLSLLILVLLLFLLLLLGQMLENVKVHNQR